jgi:PAS domain S-box-containing protein
VLQEVIGDTVKLLAKSKQDAEALQESETRFHALSDATFEGIGFSDRGRIVDANQQLARMFGYELHEVQGMDASKFVMPEDREFVRSRMLTGSEEPYEHRALRKDGTVIVVEVRPRMMSFRGRPIRVTAIRDITERKRVEEMLEAERRRLFAVLEELPVFIYLQAPDYSIRFANRYFREHFGEPEGKTCYDVLWGMKKPCETCPTFRVFDTKKAQVWERTQSMTDRIYQVYDYPFTDIDGSLLVLAMGFDITDRKHMEMALKESREQLFRFMNSASDSFYLLNAQLDFVEINSKGLEIMGKRREDVIGKNIADIVPDIKTSGRYEKHLEVIRTGKPFVIERFVPHPTFGNLHFVLKLFKVGDGLGVIASDITERKRAEEQLQLYTAKLEETNAELSQFAHVVSHDLKTPLRAIHNYADFLCEDLEETLGSEQKAYLQGINQAVREANALIEDLLRLSRIDRQSTDIEMVEVGSFLQSLFASLNLSAEVELVMQDDWPTLEVAPVVFRQIFQNLIGNAVKFNASPQKRVELGWQPVGNDHYELFVRDNGIGINPSFQKKIFHVFERLHTKEEFEGTGIGLAIVNKAVSKLGGSVRVESTPGEGSTFFVRLSRKQKV